MIKKTIEFEDFNGNKRKGDYYFNLSTAEFLEMQLRAGGNLEARLELLAAQENNDGMIDFFKDLIRNSYGRKTEDGVSFLKTREAADAFMGSDAYGTLFIELMSSLDAMKEFFLGVVPAKAAAAAREAEAQKKRNAPQDHLSKQEATTVVEPAMENVLVVQEQPIVQDYVRGTDPYSEKEFAKAYTDQLETDQAIAVGLGITYADYIEAKKDPQQFEADQDQAKKRNMSYGEYISFLKFKGQR
jgi:hypothetical protein